jgi:hypothetical protein
MPITITSKFCAIEFNKLNNIQINKYRFVSIYDIKSKVHVIKLH